MVTELLKVTGRTLGGAACTFALRRYVLAEVDAEPYIMLRGDLGEAVMALLVAGSTLALATYVIGEERGRFEAKVRLENGELHIGCQRFDRNDTKTILRWLGVQQ